MPPVTSATPAQPYARQAPATSTAPSTGTRIFWKFMESDCAQPRQVLEPAHHVHRLLDALHRVDRQALDVAGALLRRVGPGHDRDREPELGRFAQTLLAARRRTHL